MGNPEYSVVRAGCFIDGNGCDDAKLVIMLVLKAIS